jgi:hypothetical protein
LRYMHHARNAEEHGLARITEYQPPRAEFFGVQDPPDVSELKVLEDGSISFVLTPIEVRPGVGMIPSMRVLKPTAMLVPVVDRGVTYDVPSSHLGANVDQGDPFMVGGLMLAYLKVTVAEAEALL